MTGWSIAQRHLLDQMGIAVWQQRQALPNHPLVEWLVEPMLDSPPAERQNASSLKQLHRLLDQDSTIFKIKSAESEVVPAALVVAPVSSLPEQALYLQPLSSHWLLLFRMRLDSVPPAWLWSMCRILACWLEPGFVFKEAKPFRLTLQLARSRMLTVDVVRQSLRGLIRRYSQQVFMLVIDPVLMGWLDDEWQLRSAAVALDGVEVEQVLPAVFKKQIYQVVVQCLLSGK